MKRIVNVLLFVTMSCAFTVAAQDPASPALDQFHAWLTAFNSGDRASMQKFLAERMPSHGDDLDRYLMFRQRTGGFDERRNIDTSATKATILVQERDGEQFARITVELEDGDTHRVTNIGIRAVPTPPDFAPARLNDRDVATQFHQRMAEWDAKGLFSGAVLVAHGGKPIFEEAVGMADREAGVRNKTTTRFRMGSMNKMFTATAILQLAQAGKLKITDPFGKYITDYPNKDVAAKVTIHQLLTHTGGTGDIFGPDFDAHRLQLRVLNDYVNLYGTRALQFEPGSKWEYSNYGFILLGVVIERVSGQSYYDYVKQHIFIPAGMDATGSEPEDVTVLDRSKGYMQTPNGWALNTDTLPYRGTSAGGGYTTVDDLLRFANAIQSHKLLNEDYTRMLVTGKVEIVPGTKYAYGFQESVDGSVRYFGHSGGAPGMNGELRIFPASGYILISLSNIDGGTQKAMTWLQARALVTGNPPAARCDSAGTSTDCIRDAGRQR